MLYFLVFYHDWLSSCTKHEETRGKSQNGRVHTYKESATVVYGRKKTFSGDMFSCLQFHESSSPHVDCILLTVNQHRHHSIKAPS